MWYPFYYSPQLDEDTPWPLAIIFGLIMLLTSVIVFTLFWMFPAMFFDAFNWTSWITGYIIFIAFFLVLFLVSYHAARNFEAKTSLDDPVPYSGDTNIKVIKK